MPTFTRLLGFLRPYRRDVAISFALAAVAMVMTVLLPTLTGDAVEAAHKGANAAVAHRAGARAHEHHELVVLALIIVGCVIARWGLTLGRRLVAGRVSLGLEYDLRQLLYGHLQRLELAFFDRQQTGQLMSRVTVDLQAVRFFLGYGLVFIMQSALTIVLAGAAMIYTNPLLGVIAIAPTPLVVLIANRYGRRARPAIGQVQQRIAELTAEAEENISGVRVVKAFAREDHQHRRFSESVGRVFDQAMVATRLEARYNPVIAFLPQLGLTAVLLVGGQEVIHAHLTLGHFSSFYLYLNMLISPMRSLGVTLGLAQRATASGTRVFALLDRAPQMTEAPGAPPLPAGVGAVELRSVTLRYDSSAERMEGAAADSQAARDAGGAGKPAGVGGAVLDSVDLSVAAGTTVALVGPMGSGKTSLVSLLSRLYDPTAGKVLIDGADLRSVSLQSVREAVGVVSDDPFLFSATVAENIAYARPDASAAEIEQAARMAQAEEFIARLPQGYDTRVGERGLTLSGGQRQRLAIARALLANPRVLVLDDATSSVDASTEQSIKRALATAMQGRTTFIIAHRPSTIQLAELVVVLDHGHIVAQGSHDEVLARSAFYRELVGQDDLAATTANGTATSASSGHRREAVSGR
jgi:ATP-binding cassette subfamily B protein